MVRGTLTACSSVKESNEVRQLFASIRVCQKRTADGYSPTLLELRPMLA
jgi:hypothetical protein